MRSIAGVLRHPRATMAAQVAAPAFLLTWALVLTIWLVPAAWLLSTPVGQQALVDERVRIVEAFGGSVDDARYAALQLSPPWSAYLTSGGRLLVTPPATLLVALGLLALARVDRVRMGLPAALAVVVHASVVLALQQSLTVPVQYVRESITSPTNLAVFLPGLEDGTLPARLFGAIDVFGLWWIWLLAVGLSAATGRPARRYGWRLLAVYVGSAALAAAAMAAAGGT